MKNNVYDRLLRREVGQDGKRYSNIRGIYGDRRWVEELDIVNELPGHSGCVNALSWSRSGSLLASGSDDHRINIHSYNPESSTSQFSLTTSIVTGHRSNIFSVKFMPYSNDRTIVSATDDVRIFDIEHSGHNPHGTSTASRRQPAQSNAGLYRVPAGLTLTEGDTNAKAFRCHSDTVKRIVTEDSPYYFLTCSEDGDVRQWDIRLPSSHYPPSRDSLSPPWARGSDNSDNIPPPLISYSRYHLDLNTVSCSPSQPHYIALGGAHLHCFLHDRRMLGRDKLRERGAGLASSSNRNSRDEELLGQATQCVKKFAPDGQQRMGRHDNGHITACKISDANPNELIVSWSGDWIYSFDIMRSPDASEETRPSRGSNGNSSGRVHDQSRKRKRDRTQDGNHSDDGAGSASSRQRTESSHATPSGHRGDLALRVNYANGQTEDIPIENSSSSALPIAEQPSASNTEHFRIAKCTVKIQKLIFSTGQEFADSTANFTSILGFAASILPEMDQLHRTWRYPMDPRPMDVSYQNRLRDGRSATRRFVQAVGTLARVLGGQLRTGGNSSAIISQYFSAIQPAPSERPLPRHEQFGYDFLKAILLWLDSGLGAVIEGFTGSSMDQRRPIRPDSDMDAIDEDLIPYLLELATDDPVVDVSVSRFEKDERRVIFASEVSAVISFAHALKLPFADLTGAVVPASGATAENHAVQDRKAAIEKWAFKVGRGVLLNAAKDIKFNIVDRSFGGSGIPDATVRADEAALREQQEDIDPLEDSEEEGSVINADIVQAQENYDTQSPTTTPHRYEQIRQPSSRFTEMQARLLAPEPTQGSEQSEVDEDDEDEDDGDMDPVASDYEEESDDDADSDGLARTRSGRLLWRSDFDRSFTRNRVEGRVPCSEHTRKYTGHCNIRTVKDVNFFGLQDEYVVSGSDSGHVFIWDKKTTQLVNILEGDGEVVNVVQGHPYEPTMAVSGIDNTIKIFSPDSIDQSNARNGIGVQAIDTDGFSSLAFGRRRRRTRRNTGPTTDADMDSGDEEPAPGGLYSRKCMKRAYQITSQNDVERQHGRNDARVTRTFLAQIAQQLHAQRARHENEDGSEHETGGTVVIDEDACTTM